MPARGGNLKSGSGGIGVGLEFHIEGIEKTEADFKTIRSGINTLLRDTVVAVGEREVLPGIRSRMAVKDASVKRGLPTGAMRSSMYIKRDRTSVFVASRLRGPKNRALGWMDFGGVRAYTTRKGTEVTQTRREGPRAILHTIDEVRPILDSRLLETLLTEFKTHGFEVA